MGSLKIKCLKKEGNKIELGVWIIDPEVDIFNPENYYFLQIIWMAFYDIKSTDFELNKLITEAQIYNIQWVYDNQDTYVTSVELLESFNYPNDEVIKNLKPDEFQKFWKDLSRVPYSKFEITMASASYIDHIHKNMNWECTPAMI